MSLVAAITSHSNPRMELSPKKNSFVYRYTGLPGYAASSHYSSFGPLLDLNVLVLAIDLDGDNLY